MGNVETVKKMYEAFGRGDIPAILEHLDENVEWDTEIPVDGVPWLAPQKGKSNVPKFFQSLAPINFTTFEPKTFFEQGDEVFVYLNIVGERDGKKYEFPYEGHLWFFTRDGKVRKYQHITDTAMHWRMAHGH